MPRIVGAFSIVFFVLAGAPALLLAQPSYAAELSFSLKDLRGPALRDTTPINFCRVDMFWNARGVAVDSGVRPLSRYWKRSDCPSEPSEVPYAVISSVTESGDSIIVEGVSMHFDTQRFETYIYERSSVGLRFREYRIRRIWTYDPVANPPAEPAVKQQVKPPVKPPA